MTEKDLQDEDYDIWLTDERTSREPEQQSEERSGDPKEVEPKNIKRALKDPNWIIAMQEELNEFERSKFRHLGQRPMNKIVIGTRWVFRNKLDEQGNITRNQARHVVQRYNQEEGTYYDEPFSPVARMEAIRMLTAFAVCIEFTLYQMDMKNAFLNVYLKEKVVCSLGLRVKSSLTMCSS
nr:uncharacterized mitochondrial protein AtMg00820-like [Nicotiana tomentosiformis]